MTGPGTLPMPDLVGKTLGSRRSGYAERDVILYALAVGASATDLDLVYERQLRVLPTFAMPLGLWAVEAAGELGAYDRARTLHVGQELQVHRPLPVVGAIETDGVIEAVWDKGSAALVEIKVTSDLFDAKYVIYVPGAGGFGGERGPSAARETEPAEAREPHETSVATTANQAALYRLTGDLHPVHIDPAAARAAGFDRPILHGLCTLGAVARALAAVAGRHPASLRQLSARLTAPVYPGASIDVSCGTAGPCFDFVASVVGTGVVSSGSGAFAAGD
jgi:acyl dehydratase